MPNFSLGLLAVLFLASAIIRRIIRQFQVESRIRNSLNQQRQAASPQPVGFQEAAPYQHPLLRKEEPQKPEPRTQIEQSEEGQRHMADTPAFNEKMERRRKEADLHAASRAQKAHPQTATKKPSVMPVLSGSSLVQAVITKEILTRPPSARKPYYQARRGT